MIKANELRIGNKLMCDVRVVTVEGIHTDTVLKDKKLPHIYVSGNIRNSNYYCLLLDEVEPIPLSPELLERLGFKSERIEHATRWYHWHIGENPFTQDYIMTIKENRNGGYFFYNNGYHKLQFVHQLQNLYFALTGEELTIPEGDKTKEGE